jgi:hypothetical protein
MLEFYTRIHSKYSIGMHIHRRHKGRDITQNYGFIASHKGHVFGILGQVYSHFSNGDKGRQLEQNKIDFEK